MGMYTQARGWINVNSIGSQHHNRIIEIFEKAKKDFIGKVERDWVADDSIVHFGGNGSAYIFFGTELKNYNSEAEQWIEHLVSYFPNAEGRIDFQYEEVNIPTGNEDRRYDLYESEYWLISDGEIIKKDTCDAWCYGCGNMFNQQD